MSYSISNHITWLGPVNEVSGSAMLGTTTIVSTDIAALPDVAAIGN
jgi:hypothetical protein